MIQLWRNLRCFFGFHQWSPIKTEMAPYGMGLEKFDVQVCQNEECEMVRERLKSANTDNSERWHYSDRQ